MTEGICCFHAFFSPKNSFNIGFSNKSHGFVFYFKFYSWKIEMMTRSVFMTERRLQSSSLFNIPITDPNLLNQKEVPERIGTLAHHFFYREINLIPIMVEDNCTHLSHRLQSPSRFLTLRHPCFGWNFFKVFISRQVLLNDIYDAKAGNHLNKLDLKRGKSNHDFFGYIFLKYRK